MRIMQRELSITRLRQELNLVEQCQHYYLPLWQCPQLLFVGMGGITVITILIFFFVFSSGLDPYSVALISLALAGFLLVQTFIVIYALERTAEANRIQVDFMNIVSHQLRTPVTAAQWALDLLLKESGSVSDEEQQYVNVARNAIRQMQQLVASILGITRIESGLASRRSEQFSFGDLVQEITENFRKYTPNADIHIENHLVKDAPKVYADPAQVRFVVEHLLDNAVRYSQEPAHLAVTVNAEGSFFRVTIEDRGVGIPVHEQAHVFERFFRASNAYTVAPGGAGLSLYVARAIVEGLKGRIGFTSDAKKGSTFWFTLPASSVYTKK